MLSKTTLPKVTLSHKWFIDSVESFNNCGVGGLKSPSFSMFLPCSNGATAQDLSWHLLIQKKLHEMPIQLYLKMDSTPGHEAQPKMSISDRIFSFLHPETNETLYSSAPVSHNIYEGMGYCYGCTVTNEWMKCLFGGTLVVQCTATIVCIDEPIQTVHVTNNSLVHKLYKDETFTDVTIKCGKEEFKVHKAVLGLQCPFLKTMLEDGENAMNGASPTAIPPSKKCKYASNVIEISDVSPAALSDLLAYLYIGTAPNLSTVAEELLKVSKKYELPHLVTKCINELKMNIMVDNVVEMLLLAELHGISDLKKVCLNFIHFNLGKVCETSKWKCLKDNPDQYGTLLFEALEYSADCQPRV